MKKLVIIGAGGMGRSLYSYAQESIGYNETFTIKGYLDDNVHALDGFDNYPTILGTIGDYEIQEDDVFINSLGSIIYKNKTNDIIKSKGGKFQSLIHKTAIIRNNVNIGAGCLVGQFASIGADTVIGEHCLIQAYSVVGHDCHIGNNVRIDTHAVCIGGVTIEDNAIVHTGAIINHNIVVENGAHVAAGSFVIKRVKAGTTVYGNPAKLLK